MIIYTFEVQVEGSENDKDSCIPFLRGFSVQGSMV